MNSQQRSPRPTSQNRRSLLQTFAAATVTFALLTLSACASNAAPTAGSARGEAGYAAPVAQEIAAPQAPQDMYFADYGVNGFVESATDNLSTFGVDVDTGSYTLVRSYLDDGNLPPSEAVRVEEFINYFDYGYAYPTAEQTFAIELAAAPSPFTQNPNSRILRVGIQGYDIPAEERQDVALTFVIDVSGSMDMENRLGLVKRSLASLVEQLRPSDSVAIVVYGSTAWVVLPMTSAAEQGTILNAINSLQPDGSTNAEEGLRLAYQQAWESFNPQALNRVILLSDGVANVGETGPEA
ncbi:MAG TPA: von Willebrand factor type A domain-containing protein, partial [Caldilineaceae bacterium]|nr:von Willebrand factor type A domain-containing protein [Caldilineaceae bacterium]